MVFNHLILKEIKKMKKFKLSLLFSICLVLIFAATAFAQTEIFSDENVDYTFEIPEKEWKMTSKPSNLSPNVEYVYGNTTSGHLEIRKLSMKSGEDLDDVIQSEEDKLQFKPGYVTGKEEVFRGSLIGKVFNFEFIRSGRNMSGRYYFLKADETTVYVLRFEAFRDKLLTIRNQTDSMARTFKIKSNGNGKGK
jgi:hypothetical protein